MTIPKRENTKREHTFPVRGVPGGWRDVWDDPDDAAELRERARLADELTEQRAREIAQQLRQEQDEAA
jgi:hypothetical protein